MSEVEDLEQRIRTLRERISDLSRASVRISTSLDLDTVLAEVVDSARSLTGARFGSVTTVDSSGEFQDFVTRGTTDSERERLLSWPEGPRLFEYLRDLPGPIRVKDLPSHVAGLGIDGSVLLPYSPFLGTPMRHRGELIGSFWLAQNENDTEFTAEDEELLVLFAGQAAAAIANAKSYRDEQHTRANLEALIDTSPVGVVVFNATSAEPISVNREATRIVEHLRGPGYSHEELLRLVSCKRADGSEFSLDQLPLATILGRADTIRAEEFVLSIPDGTSISALVSATPVHGDQGIETVVVTLQDLEPLQDIDRMRADFLNMVSQELRFPLTSIKGATTTVLDSQRSLSTSEVLQFVRIVDDQAGRMTSLIGDLFDAGSIDAGTLFINPEPTDSIALVNEAQQAFVDGGGIHQLQVDIQKDLPPVLADRGRIVQVLGTLLTNATRFAPTSTIRIAATFENGFVEFSVDDDGRGLTSDELKNLFRKYTSSPQDNRRLDLNVGLAVCKGIIETHGGRIRAESAGLGTGTRIAFTLPIADNLVSSNLTGSNATELGERIRVLAVDNDPQTLRFVRETLDGVGFDTHIASHIEEFERILKNEKPALVLINLLMPGNDGVELVSQIPALEALPIIFMSPNNREESFSRALNAGAEDYLVKPFAPTELIARVRGVLRRREGPALFTLHDLTIDYPRRRATLADHEIDLTATEYNLLATLSRNAGRVLSYDELARRVWDRRDEVDPKLVRAFIKRLRGKLSDPVSNPTYILTQRGVGYQMPMSSSNVTIP